MISAQGVHKPLAHRAERDTGHSKGVSSTVPNRRRIPNRFQQRVHGVSWPRAKVAASHGSPLIDCCGADALCLHYTRAVAWTGPYLPKNGSKPMHRDTR